MSVHTCVHPLNSGGTIFKEKSAFPQNIPNIYHSSRNSVIKIKITSRKLPRVIHEATEISTASEQARAAHHCAVARVSGPGISLTSSFLSRRLLGCSFL